MFDALNGVPAATDGEEGEAGQEGQLWKEERYQHKPPLVQFVIVVNGVPSHHFTQREAPGTLIMAKAPESGTPGFKARLTSS